MDLFRAASCREHFGAANLSRTGLIQRARPWTRRTGIGQSGSTAPRSGACWLPPLLYTVLLAWIDLRDVPIGAFWVVWVLLSLLFQKQIAVTPTQLSIRNRWDVFRGEPGIVRAIEPDTRLVHLVSGRLLLRGRERTWLPLSAWYPFSRRHEAGVIAACRRAGVTIVDELAEWRRVHILRCRMQLVLFVGGSALLVAGVGLLLTAGFEAQPAVVLLLVGGCALGFIGWLAGPPDVRPTRRPKAT